ncbi:MAG: PKD domain-containing protein [Bacteroidetes bacterium]|nr:PKD domain-containing protein [Bacteroidota bacterium]
MKSFTTMLALLLLLCLDHSFLYAQNNAAFSWGRNVFGQLGDGTLTDRYSPVQIGTEANWASICGGGMHSLAIKKDGSLWAWGYNMQGQLGDGTHDRRTSPVQIGTETNWAAVSCGYEHTIALKSNGTLWAWGYNGAGQLGDGTTSNKSTPVQIGTATDWVSVSCGRNHTLATKSNGTLWAWGYNGAGQLGDGTTTNQTNPAQIGTAATWSSVSGGAYHSLALKNDGSMWAWGENAAGQLGVGDTTDRYSPVQIGTAADWASVTCGMHHTLAKNSSSTLWAWGHNGLGQLGIGDTATYRPSPVQVGTATNWASVSGGNLYTLALVDTVVVYAGPDQLITLGYGVQSATLTATASGGTTPYSYLWSTSETTSSITVYPTVPTTYTVTVTDADSETWTDDVVVDVLDARCGENLDLVLYCEDGVTKCNTERKATRAIANGATLGPCTWNQPPVAVASAIPTSGTAPCVVSFSSSGSYDPDGRIASYHWDFGDSYGWSTLPNPSYAYQLAGTWTVVLTVTDDDSATATDTIIITLISGPRLFVWIPSQNVTRVTLPGGKFAAEDVIVVRDNADQLKSGVMVTAAYTGPTSGTVSGTTGSNGAVTLSSMWDRNPSGTWCFTVTDVQLSGYTFNPTPSIMSACEPPPKALAATATNSVPSAFSLSQNYPNPFNPSTTIEYGIPEEGAVRLAVYDLYGREVVTLVDEFRVPGSYHAEFGGSNLPSGVYMYQLAWNGSVLVKAMTLLK